MEIFEQPFHVVIVAAGSGERAGGSIPKQYALLAGRPLIRHCLETFLQIPAMSSLVVVINEKHKNWCVDAIRGLSRIKLVYGGSSRSDSVYKGLLSLNMASENDIVLIHDAARPFITKENILSVASTAARTGSATLAVPVTDTLRYSDISYVDRFGLWALQTPQAFRYKTLLEAHKRSNNSMTDDTKLVAALGLPVEMVQGERSNIKITTPDDWKLANRMAGFSRETRHGSGFDVHAFKNQPTKSIRLCGIDIPFDRGLEGHSDADVGLHALTDALLGAMALGDIGHHFPPSDMRWKNASSDLFLKHAVDLIRDNGGRIVNLDLTLICEAPKIGPHREAMQQKIADVCSIDVGRISVKATTTEQLGFTGRGEGIAAQASASVEVEYGSETS